MTLASLPTPFFGREDDLVQVAGLLGTPGCRLLTLVGPGGAGKTRLALRAAARAAESGAFAHGVHFVPLQPLASAEPDRKAFAETFREGAEASQFVKRPILRRTLIAATLPLLVAPIVLLRDLGPLPGTKLRYTVWRKGLRLVISDTGRPIKPADFDSPGGMITVIPEGFQANDDALVKATVIIIKLEPGELKYPTNLNWTVDNIVAYSKICTHVGCPAALYEQTTHHILCPCHQSTFDATRGATVLFGPANRPLPQLPMGVNSEGYLVALSDFKVPVGPAFWERG